MGLFSKLFGKPDDPTADWPPSVAPLPEIRLDPFAIGSLKFNDPLEASQFLGRPDRCELSKTPGTFTLLYDSRGFELGFDEYRLSEAEFSLGYGTFISPDPGEPLCIVRLVGGAQLDENTTREVVEQIFGKPAKIAIDPDDGEEDWSYDRRNLAMRFKFTNEGRLAAWSIYGD